MYLSGPYPSDSTPYSVVLMITPKGELVMECGDASGTALLDTKARAWDVEAAAMIDDDLLQKLPPLIGPTEKVGGGLTKSW